MAQETRMTPEQQKLVADNIGLAKFLYRIWITKLQGRADYGVDANDLLSEAYFGLVRAALRYRNYGEEKGFSEESIASGQYFSIFARKSIIGQMLDYLRKIDHVHALVRSDYKTLQAKGYLSTDKTLAEVTGETDLTLERAQKVVQLVHSKPVYLDDLYVSADVGNDETVGSRLAYEETVESSALETSLRLSFVECFDSLDPLQKFVIAGKYYANRELPDLAKASNMSLAAIRKAHTDALLSIHEAFIIRLS